LSTSLISKKNYKAEENKTMRENKKIVEKKIFNTCERIVDTCMLFVFM